MYFSFFTSILHLFWLILSFFRNIKNPENDNSGFSERLGDGIKIEFERTFPAPDFFSFLCLLKYFFLFVQGAWSCEVRGAGFRGSQAADRGWQPAAGRVQPSANSSQGSAARDQQSVVSCQQSAPEKCPHLGVQYSYKLWVMSCETRGADGGPRAAGGVQYSRDCQEFCVFSLAHHILLWACPFVHQSIVGF